METITLGVLAILDLLFFGALFYTIRRYNKENKKELKEIVTAIKDIRVIKQREYNSPNQATLEPKKNEEMTRLDEAQPWTLPDDIKIEVEGGDGQIPPEFQGI